MDSPHFDSYCKYVHTNWVNVYSDLLRKCYSQNLIKYLNYESKSGLPANQLRLISYDICPAEMMRSFLGKF
jgi:hypothetical protein